MGKRHLPYRESFRADAVALVRRSGKRIAEVAADLGVSRESLGGGCTEAVGRRTGFGVSVRRWLQTGAT